MSTQEFLRDADGPVRIQLADGSVHTGYFRTDILTPTAISAFFHGDVRDMSLAIDAVVRIEALRSESRVEEAA